MSVAVDSIIIQHVDLGLEDIMNVMASIISALIVIATSFARGDETALLRTAFLESNALEGAESNAVSVAAEYFASTRNPNSYPLSTTNATRQAHGNWVVRYIHDGISPAFWFTAFIMSDGRILRANETNVVVFLSAEHPGSLISDDRAAVLDEAAHYLDEGRPISSVSAISGYVDGQLPTNVVLDVESSWSASNAVPLVRYYWHSLGGALSRGTLETTPSNTLSNVVFTNIATQVGECHILL